MSDPLRRLRLRIAATSIVGAVGMLVSASWALRFVAPPVATLPTLAPVVSDESADPVAATVDRAAYEVALWNPPPPPPPPPVPPAPERIESLRLELVGIVVTEGQTIAAIYDPTDDRIHLVRDGESIGTRSIVRVTSTFAEIQDGRRTHRLALREELGIDGRDEGGGRR